MTLKISALSISKRSLRGRHPPSELQNRFRLASKLLISNSGSQAHLRDACALIKGLCSNIAVSASGEYLNIPGANTKMFAHSEQFELPKSYGFKGGMARELLAEALQLRQFRTPRDIDLVRKGFYSTAQDRLVAERFMPNDFRHGARIELIRSLPRYFTSRDLTINEVIAFNEDIYTSIIGLLDHVSNTIRPSRYRGGTIHRQPGLDGRVLLKMIRLFAESEHFNESVELVGLPDIINFSEFDLAINLDKAYQRGPEVAAIFAETLVLLGGFSASSDPLGELLKQLEHLRYGEQDLIPHART